MEKANSTLTESLSHHDGPSFLDDLSHAVRKLTMVGSFTVMIIGHAGFGINLLDGCFPYFEVGQIRSQVGKTHHRCISSPITPLTLMINGIFMMTRMTLIKRYQQVKFFVTLIFMIL